MIEILTVEQVPYFHGCTCIVCKHKPVFRIVRIGGLESQICEDCIKQLYLALGEVLTTGERTNDDDKE